MAAKLSHAGMKTREAKRGFAFTTTSPMGLCVLKQHVRVLPSEDRSMTFLCSNLFIKPCLCVGPASVGSGNRDAQDSAASSMVNPRNY